MPVKKKPKNTAPPDPEFMIRVRLPDPAGYASCPSGDTDYEHAYHVAVFAAMPPGFELVKEPLGTANPRDSHGYTYLRIRCVNMGVWMGHTLRRRREAEAKLKAIDEILHP